MCIKFFFNPFGKKDFEKGLIWDISFVCQEFELRQHGLGKPERDFFDGRFEVREGGFFPIAPVEVLRGIVGRPEFSFFVFGMKYGDSFTHCCRPLAPYDSYLLRK